jgi:hypothetical protein
MSKYLAWLAVPVVLLSSSLASAAPTKSFTAAVASLPADTEMLGSSNLKAVRSTQLWKTLFPELLKMERDVPEAIDKVKKSCSIDLVGSADDVTLGLDSKEKGAIFISVAGVTEAKMLECLQKVAKSEGESVTSKKTGSITEVKSDKSKKSLFYSWQPGDVLVIAIEPEDKAMLERALGGKGALAKGKLSGRIAKANPENALTVISARSIPVEKKTVKAGDLSVSVSGGNVNVALNAEMASSSEADDVVKLAKLATSLIPKDAPKELERIAKTLSVGSSGPEVRASLVASERDLVSLIQQAIKRKSK